MAVYWGSTPGTGDLYLTGPRPWADVKGHLAVGDGVADDGPKWNNARATLPSGGGIVLVPPGSYNLATAFTFGGQSGVLLLISPGVTLSGSALPAPTGTNAILDFRSGGLTFTGAGIIVPNIGPSSSQRHTLPAVASDTVALLAAIQTLTNKTLTSPLIAALGPDADSQHTLPNVAADTVVLLAATQTLTNKTLSGAVVSGAAPATPTANVLYADSVVKAWVKITGAATPAISDDLNVSSLTDNDVGDITITWATAFANATYAAAGMCANGTYLTHDNTTAQAAGSFRVQVVTDAGGATDSDQIFVIAIGDQ